MECDNMNFVKINRENGEIYFNLSNVLYVSKDSNNGYINFVDGDTIILNHSQYDILAKNIEEMKKK